MPRKKTVNLEDLVALDVENDVEEQSFQDFISEVGPGSSVIEIYRMYPNGRRPYVDTISPDVLKESPLEYLRDTYGPGKMLLRFKGPDKKYRQGGNKVIEVEAKTPAPAPGTPPAANGNQDHASWMREQMALQQNLMMSLIAGMKGPDIGAMMTGLGAILAAIVGGAPKVDPAAMLTSLVAAFTTLRGPEKDQDWMERAGKLIEMAKNLAPDSGGSPDSVYGVVRDVGKAIVEKIDVSKIGMGALPAGPVGMDPQSVTVIPPQASIPAPAAPIKTEVKIGPPVVGKTPQLTIEQWIQVAIAYLKEKARLNKDPGLFVDLILQSQEEPQWAAIVNTIERGATFEMLLAFDPEISQHAQIQDWFRRLYDGLHGELIELAGPQGPGPMDTGGPGGNPSNLA